jgi:hypothetical protein
VGNPVLPPSRFGAGYTAGAPTTQAATASAKYPGTPSTPVARTNRLAVASFALSLLFGPFLVPATVPMARLARAQNNHNAGRQRHLHRAGRRCGDLGRLHRALTAHGDSRPNVDRMTDIGPAVEV